MKTRGWVLGAEFMSSAIGGSLKAVARKADAQGRRKGKTENRRRMSALFFFRMSADGKKERGGSVGSESTKYHCE